MPSLESHSISKALLRRQLSDYSVDSATVYKTPKCMKYQAREYVGTDGSWFITAVWESKTGLIEREGHPKCQHFRPPKKSWCD